MILFAFGITPKLTLHNLVANHKDAKARPVPANSHHVQFSKAGFNCQCDNLVTESPFVETAEAVVPQLPCSFADRVNTLTATVFKTQIHHSSLRGPPAC